MGTFEISIYITEDLYNWTDDRYGDPYRAQEKAEMLIQGAFNRSDNHSVWVDKPTKTIDAPQEDIHESFWAGCVCDQDDSWCWFGSLYRWWQDWVNSNCKDTSRTSKDSNILITGKSRGGGLAAGKIACVGVGNELVNWNDYEDFGFQYWHRAAETLLEELGHCLLNNVQDQDNDGSGHDSGTLFAHDEGNVITPMGITGDTDRNNCDWYVPKDPFWDGGWELRYSECAESDFEEK